MWISSCKNSVEAHLLRINDDSCFERVSKFKLLGVWQQDNLCWNYHVEQAVKKAINRLYYLRECRKENLPTETRGITIYSTKILPLEYASPVWGSLPITLQKSCGLYKSGAQILSGCQEHPFQRQRTDVKQRQLSVN